MATTPTSPPAADRQGGHVARPVVVAVDIDGVLRVRWDEHLANIWPGLFKAEITMHRDAYPTVHHGQPPWDENGEWTAVHGFSGIGAEWIRSLLRRDDVQVVWASTWAEHANSYFAPILGITGLEAATTGPDLRDEEAPDWKIRQLIAKFPGQPLLWVDDNPPRSTYPRLEDRRSPRDRALAHTHVVASSGLGITQEDVEALNEWIDLATSSEGQRTLRARRQQEKAAEYRYRRWIRQRAKRDEERFPENRDTDPTG